MKNLINKLSVYLSRSKIKNLEFWSDHRNRTTLLLIIAEDLPVINGFNVIEEFAIPHSTWRFEIRNVSERDCRIFFQDGTFMTISGIPGGQAPLIQTVDFPGQPYVERDDIFTRIEFEDSDGIIEIVCHRIVKPNI